MISHMKEYTYIKGHGRDLYGQLARIPAQTPIKMHISLLDISLNENSLYEGAQYLGLTYSNDIDSTCTLDYGDKKLKVLYVNRAGRYNQVFMAQM